VASIPRRQHCKGRRPWLASARWPSRPHGMRSGKAEEGEKGCKEGADRRGPPVSGSGGVVGDRRAGWLCWAERPGGLAVRAGLRCKMEGVLQTSTDVVKAQSGREGFPIFLSP
jgi:hypothetical protein